MKTHAIDKHKTKIELEYVFLSVAMREMLYGKGHADTQTKE